MENREVHDLKKNIEKNLEKSVYTNDIELLNKTIDEIKENNLNIKQFMNSTTVISHTLLDRACRNANPELVKKLIDLNILAKPNFYTKYSPLYIVSHMGHYEIAELLVKVSLFFISYQVFDFYFFENFESILTFVLNENDNIVSGLHSCLFLLAKQVAYFMTLI